MLWEKRKKILMSFVLFLLRGLVKLWSALTLQGFYQNRRCAFRVLQVGGGLPTISAVLHICLAPFFPFIPKSVMTSCRNGCINEYLQTFCLFPLRMLLNKMTSTNSLSLKPWLNKFLLSHGSYFKIFYINGRIKYFQLWVHLMIYLFFLMLLVFFFSSPKTRHLHSFLR